MEVALILKIAGIGFLLAIIDKVLKGQVKVIGHKLLI